MGICNEAFNKHRILFPTVWHLPRLSQGRTQGKAKCGKKNAHSLTKTVKTSHSPPIYRYISKMVEDRWLHAARRLTSIEFSFDPCNIYHDGPRGVGYQADARSVGDSHPSCFFSFPIEMNCYLMILRSFSLSQRWRHSTDSVHGKMRIPM